MHKACQILTQNNEPSQNFAFIIIKMLFTGVIKQMKIYINRL